MPPATRQIDVQLMRGERNPAPSRGATPQELATAPGAGDVKLTASKLLPDEPELRRIIDRELAGIEFLAVLEIE